MSVVAIMVVRDEEGLLERNLKYHLNLGFDLIAVLDHCSNDLTPDILTGFHNELRILALREENPTFDHGRWANELLKVVLTRFQPDWIFPLDADEFLGIPNSIQDFVEELEARRIWYGSIGWINAAPLWIENEQLNDALDTQHFYVPWPERTWQEPGHFRKSFCRYHNNVEIVVGGHYFRRENNPQFFSRAGQTPVRISLPEARIYHYENRASPAELLEKWRKLAYYENDTTSSRDSPWTERIALIREYVKRYQEDIGTIEKRWFRECRTLWGTVVPLEQIRRDSKMYEWNHRYKMQGTSNLINNHCYTLTSKT